VGSKKQRKKKKTKQKLQHVYEELSAGFSFLSFLVNFFELRKIITPARKNGIFQQ
jgi:hypothetical protein